MNNFECRKCGKCCSNYLPLTKEEIRKLKKFSG
jgi:Fe-S-cluster containining protein